MCLLDRQGSPCVSCLTRAWDPSFISSFELNQQLLRFLLRQPASNHRLRHLLLCFPIKLIAFGESDCACASSLLDSARRQGTVIKLRSFPRKLRIHEETGLPVFAGTNGALQGRAAAEVRSIDL